MQNFIKGKRLLALSVQIYLKVEWNRVKWENRVFRCPCYNEKKAFDKVLKKFSSEDTNVQEIISEYSSYAAKKETVTLAFTEDITATGVATVSASTTGAATAAKSE